MLPIIFAATVKAAETSAWWYFLYGAGATAGAGTGGYYGWRWRNGGSGHKRQEMPKDTPINESAKQGAETKAQVNHDIENQARMAEAVATIVQDMADDESEIDSTVGKVESQQEEIKASQEIFQATLGKILLLAEQYEDIHESMVGELAELNKIFSKEEVGQLKSVYHLIEQNSAYKVEIEHYEALVKKLMKVIEVYKKEAINKQQSSTKLEHAQPQFTI